MEWKGSQVAKKVSLGGFGFGRSDGHGGKQWEGNVLGQGVNFLLLQPNFAQSFPSVNFPSGQLNPENV